MLCLSFADTQQRNAFPRKKKKKQQQREKKKAKTKTNGELTQEPRTQGLRLRQVHVSKIAVVVVIHGVRGFSFSAPFYRGMTRATLLKDASTKKITQQRPGTVHGSTLSYSTVKQLQKKMTPT